ncbi:MAG: ADP-forming succinate--CoA ligase subunit beta [Chloroflexota bacterium]
MKLFEFEAKNILKKYGIPVPKGEVINSPEKAEAAFRQIGKPAVLKAQILVAGRGKAGGIQFAENAAGAQKIASSLIGKIIKDCVVRSLLVEEKLDIVSQFYASVTIDRQARTFIVLASTEGGVDIEEVARASPGKISRQLIDFATGFTQSQAEKMLNTFKLAKSDAIRLASILSALYKAAIENDAELVELNPVVKIASGEFMAADARIIIDDNAIFRHPEFEERSLSREEDTPLEAEARKQRLAYVDLSGDIGIVGNGAGLVMSTLDMVSLLGGSPANFLDIGGGGNVEITKKGILLVMSKPDVKVLLVNVLGGITRCDIVAEAVVQALKEATVKKPIAVRMVGTNETEGKEILRQAGIKSYPQMEMAIKEVIKLKKE